MQNQFAKVALAVHLKTLFDYKIPKEYLEKIRVGMRVQVPFRKKNLIGIVTTLSCHCDLADNKIRTLTALIDETPLLNQSTLDLCQWASQYYHYPIGEIILMSLPKKLREGSLPYIEEALAYSLNDPVNLESLNRSPKKKKLLGSLLDNKQTVWTHKELLQKGFNHQIIKVLLEKKMLLPSSKKSDCDLEAPLKLNASQNNCLKVILNHLDTFKVSLIEGITGSGKTEIYLQTIAKVIAKGLQALVLVPEINLTPQTIERFKRRFGDCVTVLHSALSEKKRCENWLRTQSGKARIIIGTRSALLSTFSNLGLIIIDEEHDQSFRQQDQFRYSSRDLAIVLAKQNNLPIILGSATPSLESLFQANQGQYLHLEIKERVNQQTLPEIKVIDCRRQYIENGLSKQLLYEIKTCLEQNEQAILFINRRGYAPVLMCRSCGWHAECSSCESKMTYHFKPYFLQCHLCMKQMALPSSCPHCNDPNLNTIGVGTQRLEESLNQLFPDHPTLRIDRDTISNQTILQETLDQIHTEKPMIMIGTQMIAKGHHFPNVTLVGIIDVDNALYSSEFRAIEHMGQLMIQVAGRAGRSQKRGKVLLQSYHPENPYLRPLLHHDYHGLAMTILAERDRTHLPPFSYLAVIRAEAHHLNSVFDFLNDLLNKMKPEKAIEVIGPLPLNQTKRAGYYRGEIIFRSHSRKVLHQYLSVMTSGVNTKQAHKIRWHLEVDPIYLSN